MPDYRRHRVAGGCYFFTVNLLERRSNMLLTQEIELLRQAVRRVRKARPFTIDAFSRAARSSSRRVDSAGRR
jgi:putative transposase